mmetsp:Transcript_11590/g.35861  ORF Transcript_11590/g.35861 Transcript_11590/m.35861 type:complete len:218 (+) Transcript_11590:1136-1789(+)
MRPSPVSTSTRSNARKASARGWWMLSTHVTPPLPSAHRMSSTRRLLLESSPDVGSSRNSSPGWLSSSTAMLTRRRSPPDRPRCSTLPIVLRAMRCSPSRERIAHTRRSRCALSTQRGKRSAAWNSKYSSTVDVAGSTSCCGTYPDTERSAAGPARQPLTRTSPPTALPQSRPDRMSSSVVLPAPEGPSTAQTPLESAAVCAATPDTPQSTLRQPRTV